MPEEWITTTEAAELFKYHPNYIPRLIKSGKITARRFGHVWQVERISLLAYSQAINQQGKKRGPKTKL